MASAKRLNLMVADHLGNTPLHYAALADTPEVMGFFHQQTKGFLMPDLRLVDSRNELGETPLLKAATSGVIPVLRALIEEGSDLFAYDNCQNTLFIILIKHGHLWCFNFIFSHMRSKFGSKRVLEHLLATDKDNHGVLDWAAHVGDCNIIEYLLRQDVDLHRMDDKRRTALFWATKAGNTRAARFLILCGSNPHEADLEGISPYLVAKSRGDRELMHTMKRCRTLHKRQLHRLSRHGSGGFPSSMLYTSFSNQEPTPTSTPGPTPASPPLVSLSRSRAASGGPGLPRPELAPAIQASVPTSTMIVAGATDASGIGPGIQMETMGPPISMETIAMRSPSPVVVNMNKAKSSSSIATATKTNSNGSTSSFGSSNGGGVYSGMTQQQLSHVQQLQAQALGYASSRAQGTSSGPLGHGCNSGEDEPAKGGTYADKPRSRTVTEVDVIAGSPMERVPPMLYNLSYDYGRLTNFLYRHLLCCHCLCAHSGGCEELNQLSTDSVLLSHVDEQSEQSSVVTTTGVLIKRSNAIHSTLIRRGGYLIGFAFTALVVLALAIYMPWYIWLLTCAVLVLFHHKASTWFPEPYSQEKNSKISHGRHSSYRSGSGSGNESGLNFNYAALIASYRRGSSDEDPDAPMSTLLVVNGLAFCKAVATAPEKHMGGWIGVIMAYFLYIALNLTQHFAPGVVEHHFNGLGAVSAVAHHPTLFGLVCLFFGLTVYFWLWIVYISPDPGIIDTRCEDFDEIMNHSVRLHAAPPSTLYCRTSLVKKPLRSKYCAHSGFVIARMDHFCVWLNCSIGYTNHITFMNFLFSHTIAAILTVILIAREVHTGLEGDEHSNACEMTSDILSSSYFFPVLLCTFAALAAVGLCMLTIEQCWNIAHNLVGSVLLSCDVYLIIQSFLMFLCFFFVLFRPLMSG